MSESVTLIKILSIVFPIFSIVLLGFAYGRRHDTDMNVSNQLNMDIFIPALVFSALADQSFILTGHYKLALGAFIIISGSGLLGWLISKTSGIHLKAIVPTMMFNNCGNLGLPLAMLAFGREGLSAAVMMFLVSNLMHFSFGLWFLDHQAKWHNAWRAPVILAALAGLGLSLSGFTLWQPLQMAIKMLGDVSIPMALFALGVRIASSHLGELRIGLIGALTRPVSGILIAWLLSKLMELQGVNKSVLIIFGALPPAVINYVFAERYNQRPNEVAAIVLIGNIAAVAILPLVLAWVL